jgi:hypothetical protein
MNKTYFAVALILAVGLSSTTGAAYALSETERYNSGYSHGYMDARNGAASYCSTSDHTFTFCQGYNAGYHAGQVQTQQVPSSPPSSPPSQTTPQQQYPAGYHLNPVYNTCVLS